MKRDPRSTSQILAEVPDPRAVCPPHTWTDIGGFDKCALCGISWLEWTKGFGLRTSTFQMPPSREHRKKSAVAKRFGKAMGEGD